MISVKALFGAVVGATMLSLSQGSAATINVSSQHTSVFGDVAGANKWYVGVDYTNGTESRSGIGAGVFRLVGNDGSGAKNFLAFCLSPFEFLDIPLTYTVGTSKSVLTTQMLDRLSALANGAWSQIAGSDTAGAFQLAAWEIVSEKTDNPLDISDGLFKVTSSSSATALTLAQNWLTSVGDGSFHTNPSGITILSEDGTQDLMTYAPVPLPGSVWFLGLAMLGFGAVARKRHQG